MSSAISLECRPAAKISRSVEHTLPATLQRAQGPFLGRTVGCQCIDLVLNKILLGKSGKRNRKGLGKQGELPHSDIALVAGEKSCQGSREWLSK